MDSRMTTQEQEEELKTFGEFASKWAAVILILFTVLFFSQQSHASYFVEVGQSQFQKPANGLWWQDGYTHQDDFKSLYGRTGAIHSLTDHLSISGSLYSLGRYQQTANAVQDRMYINYGCSKSPTENFMEHGSIYGVSLTGILHTVNNKFFIEGGYTYQRQSFKMEYKAPTSEAPYITYQDSLWGIGKVISVGMNYKNWRGSASLYTNEEADKFNDGRYPSGVNKVLAFSIGRNF